MHSLYIHNIERKSNLQLKTNGFKRISAFLIKKEDKNLGGNPGKPRAAAAATSCCCCWGVGVVPALKCCKKGNAAE